jgi:orotidine-5'-phosphate decarboxylase
MKGIVHRERSIIPACDVNIDEFETLIQQTSEIAAVGAYKISAVLGLSVGLPRVVEIARKYTSKPLIYDHQKAGTDIPDTGAAFARMLKGSGIDAVILFPLAGPATQEAWVSAARDADLPVIIGAHMTHPKFLSSEGGYINDGAVDTILRLAAAAQVCDYVVPGNQPSTISKIRQLLTSLDIDPTFYAPGFISQGGKINTAAEAAGPHWHAIVGRAIYGAADMRAAATSLAAGI